MEMDCDLLSTSFPILLSFPRPQTNSNSLESLVWWTNWDYRGSPTSSWPEGSWMMGAPAVIRQDPNSFSGLSWEAERRIGWGVTVVGVTANSLAQHQPQERVSQGEWLLDRNWSVNGSSLTSNNTRLTTVQRTDRWLSLPNRLGETVPVPWLLAGKGQRQEVSHGIRKVDVESSTLNLIPFLYQFLSKPSHH